MPRSKAVWGNFFVQGLFQSALPFTLINWGEKHISSGLAGVLNATPPMFVLVITFFIGSAAHKLTGRKAFDVAPGMLGVMVTIGFESLRDIGSAAPPCAGRGAGC